MGFFGSALVVMVVAYIAHTAYTMYGLFHPPACQKHCIQPFLAKGNKLQLKVYTSIEKSFDKLAQKKSYLIYDDQQFDVDKNFESSINVTLPNKTRLNGTLHVHVFVIPVKQKSLFDVRTSYRSSALTLYTVPQSKEYNLITESHEAARTEEELKVQTVPISHWKSILTLNVMNEKIAFDRFALPMEIYPLIKTSPDGEYLPILFIDDVSNRVKDLIPINETIKEVPLTIRYNPISIGRLRLWLNLRESIKTMHSLGFSEKDTDEVKGIFADTNFYLLMLTFVVSVFHLLFDFLAFKNDISFWKSRDSMMGLSTREVIWRCVSHVIIFLYLYDQETVSLLVLIPAFIGTIIEVWKVTKAFKVRVTWKGYVPKFELGKRTEDENRTEAFDSEAMKYLSYALYPLCIGGASYSLIYIPHKSWYSWCINSLVNGVYMFGFLFMLPQLFVNYKLKSVAHLPWRAFMYKAFNTFIDDIFAFIITMPTAHRLSCFRDDVVFLIYLYQRWLYPVDKTRANEYGQVFDDSKSTDKKKKTE